MPIISIFSGSYCDGGEVARKTAEELGYRLIGRELLEIAAERYGVTADKLLRAMYGPPPFFNKFTHERERSLAYVKATLAELIQQDDVVYHGPAGHLLPGEITHVMRICLIANLDYRVKRAVAEEGISEKEAQNRINQRDGEHARWTRHLFGHDPYDEELYDILIAMQASTVEKAVELITGNARKPAVQPTEESKKAQEDFILAAKVQLVLAEKGHDVDVSSRDGNVRITINKYTSRLEHLQKQLESLAGEVEGVKSVKCYPGTHFVPPSLIVPKDDFEMPTKVLLVDDEREFVHTLSDRLQTRNLDSAIVYDGEEALSFVRSEEPEVMVLDLKMPGIDGIEVLRRVKREHPGVEVIILTGHGSEKEEKLAMELGAFAYLQKPVDIDVLSQKMQEAYRRIGKSRPKNGPGEDDR